MAHPMTSDPTRPDPPSQAALAAMPGYQRIPTPPPSATRPDPPGPDLGGYGGPASSEPEDRTPTSRRVLGKLTAARTAPYEAIARGALRALGGLANARLAVDEADECFLPDNDDEKNVPPPLGRLMARRMPFDMDAADLTDLEDITAAGVGVIAWFLKGVTNLWEARRELRRAAAAAQAGVHRDPGTGEP
jgi:hypothetical protein